MNKEYNNQTIEHMNRSILNEGWRITYKHSKILLNNIKELANIEYIIDTRSLIKSKKITKLINKPIGKCVELSVEINH